MNLKYCSKLELLSDHKVELALTVDLIVESISPVNSEQTNHRQEYPDADSGRTFDLERIEFPDVRPAVTTLEEEESING